MIAASPPQGLVAALRGGPDAGASSERAELEGRAERLRAERDEAAKRLTMVEGELRRIERTLARMPADAPPSPEDEDRRLRAAVRAGLAVDLQIVAERADGLADLLQARARTIAQADGDTERRRRMAEVDELERLDRLRNEAPTGRVARAVAQRANQLRRRLRPYLVEAEAELPELDAPTHEIAVLGALEPLTGPPTALCLVLPVPHEVHSDWRRQGDRLTSRLAWRVMSALSVALRDAGAPDAPIRSTRFGDCLSFQVWLGDSDAGAGLKDALTAGFDRIHEEGQELRSARLELFLAWVEPEILAGGGAG